MRPLFKNRFRDYKIHVRFQAQYREGYTSVTSTFGANSVKFRTIGLFWAVNANSVRENTSNHKIT